MRQDLPLVYHVLLAELDEEANHDLEHVLVHLLLAVQLRERQVSCTLPATAAYTEETRDGLVHTEVAEDRLHLVLQSHAVRSASVEMLASLEVANDLVDEIVYLENVVR